MRTVLRVLAASFVVLVLTSCNVIDSKPTPLPTPSAIDPSLSIFNNVQTPTPRPTVDREPTRSQPTATSTPTAQPITSGTPVATWNEIPVMPAALSGSGDSQKYSFMVNASVDEIKAFYFVQMDSQGWEYFATGEGGEAGAIFLMFTKDNFTATILILPQSDAAMQVMMFKS